MLRGGLRFQESPNGADSPRLGWTSSVDVFPLPPAASTPGLTMHTWSGVAEGKKYTGHIATVEDPRYFSFQIAKGGSPHRATTTATAAYHGCEYATNGGFFDMSTGAPEGNVLIDKVVVSKADFKRANFGITTTGNYTIGYITQDDFEKPLYPWTTLLQGNGWLIREGKYNVNASIAFGEISKSFADEMAPR